MAENEEVQLPGFLGTIEQILKGVEKPLKGLLKFLLEWGSVATTFANDAGREFAQELGGAATDLVRRVTPWAVSQARKFVTQGVILYTLKWLIIPLWNICVVATFWEYGTGKYFAWQFFPWLAYFVLQLLFCLRFIPAFGLAGIAKSISTTPFKSPNPLAVLGWMKEVGIRGAQEGIDLARRVAVSMWQETAWFVIFLLSMLLCPAYVLPNFSILIPSAAVLYLIMINNTSGWGNKDWRGRTVLAKETDGGAVGVKRDDGTFVFEDVYKPQIPNVHRRWLIPLSTWIIILYIALAWVVFLGTAAAKQYDKYRHQGGATASELVSRPLIDGRSTPIGVAPREPWYTLDRMTHTELNVLVFHAAIIGMVLLAMLFSASQPWRGYAAPFLVALPALYYREWAAFGVILLVLLIVYSTVRPRAALAPA